MVYCLGQRCTFEVACDRADAITICGDGLPTACPMQRRLGDVWFALLILPVGKHSFRYLARRGSRTVCLGQETVSVTETESTAELNMWTQSSKDSI